MAGERSADDIQRDIERARASLATSVDQLAYRTSPKRVTENVKQTLLEKARTPQGQAVIGGVALFVGFMVVRRIRKH
ncbi:MAG TPA: DUF3618 domain-containing protein [Jatrophihabitantaceae bacterium]|nr:DUF3618 domain-containing protein [Jatrophihabitantaceae bacterium]